MIRDKRKIAALILFVVFTIIYLKSVGSNVDAPTASTRTRKDKDYEKQRAKVERNKKKTDEISEERNPPECKTEICNCEEKNEREEKIQLSLERINHRDQFIEDVFAGKVKGTHLMKHEKSDGNVFYYFFPTIDCVKRERVGNYGDGGKWLCNPDYLKKSCRVYSFGGRDEVSFEKGMFERYGCETHTFDPTPGSKDTIDELIKDYPDMHMYPLGLGPVSGYPDDPKYELRLKGEVSKTLSLMEIAKKLGHKRVDILKIDIETSEWSSVPQFLEDPEFESLGVTQILIEMHSRKWGKLEDKKIMVRKFQEFFTLLESKGFHIFMSETNIYSVGSCEYFFIHKDYVY